LEQAEQAPAEVRKLPYSQVAQCVESMHFAHLVGHCWQAPAESRLKPILHTEQAVSLTHWRQLFPQAVQAALLMK
jgi:hypothetical protein